MAINLTDKIPESSLEAVKECIKYILESEESHYEEWCERLWLNTKKHIYYQDKIVDSWLENVSG